jgi:hypothetical protein
MLRTGVTVGCLAAMVAAALVAVRLRDTRRAPSPLRGGEPFGERLAVTSGRAAGMILGSCLAGVLTMGAGVRLMMRVLAATSPDDAQGRRTEAEEVIGEVTVGGSLFLILAAGLGSAVVGLAFFSLLRRWLPERSLAAGLVGVAIGAGLLVRPSDLLAADNRDFTIVTPVALAVALCLITFVLFGATFGVLVDHFAARWPRPGWSAKGVAALLPFVLLVPVPPMLVTAVVGVLATALLRGLRSPSRPDDPSVVEAERPGGRPGRALLLALGGVGALSVVIAAGQVLAV